MDPFFVYLAHSSWTYSFTGSVLSNGMRKPRKSAREAFVVVGETCLYHKHNNDNIVMIILLYHIDRYVPLCLLLEGLFESKIYLGHVFLSKNMG
jgi:hypothetical protein